jgi:hypothetical protein
VAWPIKQRNQQILAVFVMPGNEKLERKNKIVMIANGPRQAWLLLACAVLSGSVAGFIVAIFLVYIWFEISLKDKLTTNSKGLDFD